MYGTPSPPQKVSGLVLKRGPKVGSKWQTRWLELRDHTVTYYKEQNGKELGNFRLSTVTAFWPASSSVDSPKPELAAFAFALDCQQPDRTVRTYNFCCLTQASYKSMIDALTVDLANQALPVRPRNHNADISGPYISSPVISSPTATSPRASNPRSISLTTRPGPPSTPASSVILPDRAPRSNTISTSAPSSAPALQRSATHTGHALPQPMVRSSVAQSSSGARSPSRVAAPANSSSSYNSAEASDRLRSKSSSPAVAPSSSRAGAGGGGGGGVRAAPQASPPPPGGVASGSSGGRSPRKPPPQQQAPQEADPYYQEEEEAYEEPQPRSGRSPFPSKKSGNLPPLPAPYVKKSTRVKGPLPPLPAGGTTGGGGGGGGRSPGGGAASRNKPGTGSIGRAAGTSNSMGRSSGAPPKKPLPMRVAPVTEDFPSTETMEVQMESFHTTGSPRGGVDSYSDMVYEGEEQQYPDEQADSDTLEIESDVRVAVWEWLPEDVETSLPLQPGDRLTILEVEGEWALGTNQDGFQGWFPASFVVKAE